MKKILTVIFLCVVTALSAQQTSDAAKVKYYEQLAGQMVEQLKSVQDENARLAARLSALERKLIESADENKSLKDEMSSLRRKFESESEARDSQLKKLYAQLEKIVKLADQPRSTPVRSDPPQGGGDSGTYEEYIVQQGATLSAIAKAYNVSVSEIKRANKLSGDMLRVGQKLLIPVKK